MLNVNVSPPLYATPSYSIDITYTGISIVICVSSATAKISMNAVPPLSDVIIA